VLAIPLHSRKYPGLVALADDADEELLALYRWFPNKNCRPGGRLNFYATTWIGRTPVRMHRLLVSWPRVEHADGNGLNNQRSNMRPTTQTQNLANQRKRSGVTSRFKGVSWDSRRDRWHAAIAIGGKQQFLGRFDDEEVAACAYDAAALTAWGEYAHLNFPTEPTRE